MESFNSKKRTKKPPHFIEWILLKLSTGIDQYSFIDDLNIEYQEKISDYGYHRAILWYGKQVSHAIPKIILHNINWNIILFINYFKTTFRNLKKEKVYTFVSIMSLSIGIACCMLLSLWILDELSFDQFHHDKDHIFQVLSQSTIENNITTPIPFAPVFKDAYPEIIYATRYEDYDDALVSRGDKVFYEKGIRVVDNDFFKIFSFPIQRGYPDSRFIDPNSIVITEKIANKYFSDEDPLGKTLTLNQKQDFTVTCVLKDVPHNSTINFNILIPYQVKLSQAQERGFNPVSWGYWSPTTFIKVYEEVSIDSLNEKIEKFIQRYEKKEDATLSLLSFNKRYFLFWDTQKYIIIFSSITFAILLIACFNFINLTTARSAKRSLEIGIRKVVGAKRIHIINQFIGESFILSLSGMFVSLLLVIIILPIFNTLTGKQLQLENMGHWPFILILTGLILFTGLVSGSYPAFLFSAFQPIHVIKSKIRTSNKGSFFRKVLVISQFIISIFLIIGTGIISKQLFFMKSRDLGYRKDDLISIRLEGASKNFYDVLKRQLLEDESIINVTGTSDNLPNFGWGTGVAEWEGKDPNAKIIINFNGVDYDFIETCGITLVEGRSYSPEITVDFENSIIVNEEMARLIDHDSVLGRRITVWDKSRTIVGVMKNFHIQSLTNKITPFFIILERDNLYHMVVRIQSGTILESLQFIKETWEKTVPVYPFDFTFINDELNSNYQYLERVGKLTISFTFIAVVLSCIGLFGLTSYTIERRFSEIGIRKVLGSSSSGIVLLLLKEYTLYVFIANILAGPVVFWISQKWLQGFAYHIKINIDLFLLSALMALGIVIISVSYQAVKGALTKPVDILRYE